jgi:hypothetical protein
MENTIKRTSQEGPYEIDRELRELAGSPEAYQLLFDDLKEQMRRMVQAGRKIDLMKGIETKSQSRRRRSNE